MKSVNFSNNKINNWESNPDRAMTNENLSMPSQGKIQGGQASAPFDFKPANSTSHDKFYIGYKMHATLKYSYGIIENDIVL